MRIGLLGKMAAGKSTLAARIVKKYPTMKIMSIAEPVKQIARDLFDMQGKDRILLQQIGTNMRDIDKDVWVDALIKKINKTDHIIVDDVRYENEIIKLKKAGFMIWYIDIEDTEQIKYLKETYKNDYEVHMKCRSHESEQMHTFKHMADKTISYKTDIETILTNI